MITPMKIDISPISENKIWQGRRYKTKEYKTWRDHIGWLLRRKQPEMIKGWVGVEVEFHIHQYRRADEMNFLKGFFDALGDAGFIQDDRFIKWHRSEKFQVASKSEEFISFKIIPLAL